MSNDITRYVPFLNFFIRWTVTWHCLCALSAILLISGSIRRTDFPSFRPLRGLLRPLLIDDVTILSGKPLQKPMTPPYCFGSPLPLTNSSPITWQVTPKPRAALALFCSLSTSSHPAPTHKRRPTNHLVQFNRSRYVAYYNELKRLKKLPADVHPDPPTPLSAALAAAGRLHEHNVIQYLQSLIHHPSPLYSVPFAHPQRHNLTKQAIERRVPLIQGAALCDQLIDGYADILIRSDLDPFAPSHLRQHLDPHAYSVCEIKFARAQTPEHILQTASYFSFLDKLLREIGCSSGASRAYLWLGTTNSDPVSLSIRPLNFLYQNASADFEDFLRDFPTLKRPPSPDASIANLTPWSCVAENYLHNIDSLRLITGIKRGQAKTISRVCNVSSLTEFVNLPSDDISHLVKKGLIPPGSERLHKQAVLQVKTRENKDGNIAFEFLPHSPRIPRPSQKDVYFDIEGYPLASEQGLEYLFGVHCAHSQEFKSWWAHTPEQEEQAFIKLIDWIGSRFKGKYKVQPHIYHYGHYEIAALRRIALRVRTSSGMKSAIAFENLLERGYFFDMYKFVKSSLLIGGANYSIKTVEKLVGVSRADDDLADAQSSVGLYFEWRRSAPNDQTSELSGNEDSHPTLKKIHDYNRRDCESLELVLAWVRDQRHPANDHHTNDQIILDDTSSETYTSENEDENILMPGACGRTLELKEADSESIRRSQKLSEQILSKGCESLDKLPALTLAHILHYYVRESSPDRRLFRERIEAAASSYYEYLLKDERCIAGVRFMGSIKNPQSRTGGEIYGFQFNGTQACSIVEGDRVALVFPSSKEIADGERDHSIAGFFTVKGVLKSSNEKRILYITGSGKNTNISDQHGAIISADSLTICDAPLREAALRRSEELIGDGRSGSNIPPYSQLTKAFLNRDIIVNDETKDNKWVQFFASGVNDARTVSDFLASRKTPGVLVIQGPPGTGKTRLSSEVIAQLVWKHNLTVAVTSNSHAAIDNLLCEVVAAGVDADYVWKVGTKIPDEYSEIGYRKNVRDLHVSPLRPEKHEGANNVESNLSSSSNDRSEPAPITRRKKQQKKEGAVVGATCYQLCRQENEGKFDVLFIDEASQVPMAHVVAISGCARYGVFVGDQQQLEMPIKGAHSGGTGQSCLSYIVGEGVVTVEAKRGLFLNTSYRMTERLCSFVSDAFYDGALRAAPSCSDNHIKLKKDGSKRNGIWFIPCEEKEDGEGNRISGRWQRSGEVKVIQKTISSLIGAELVVNGVERELKESDFMVVAPYNAQVRAIREALKDGIRVGTVDKFQGQQAAVTLISTCTEGETFDESIEGDDEESELYDGGGARQHRGLRFCLQKNRLNVAISRAQCVAIVTGNPEAWRLLPRKRFEDVEMAALYHQIVEDGGAGCLNAE